MTEQKITIYQSDDVYSEYINIGLFYDNKFEEIKEEIKRGKLIPLNAFDVCIKNNHTELAKYVHSLCDSGSSLRYDAYLACKYGNLEILKYIFSLDYIIGVESMKTAAYHNFLEIGKYLLSIGCEYTSDVTDIAIEKGNIEFLKMLIDFGLKISDKSLKIACCSGNVDILILLLNLGYKLTKAPNPKYCSKYNPLICRIYHELKLPGKYQFMCRVGMCEWCHIVKIWELWELSSINYDSYIQFLPREIVEDLERLIYL